MESYNKMPATAEQNENQIIPIAAMSASENAAFAMAAQQKAMVEARMKKTVTRE